MGSALDPGLEMFYFPKLTDEEMTLVGNKDEDYLRTFFVYPHASPDIQEDIMKLSESKSKFAYHFCLRISFRQNLCDRCLGIAEK